MFFLSDSEADEKQGNEMEYEIFEDFKEIEEDEWETDEIEVEGNGKNALANYSYEMEELKALSAFALRVRAKNSSGWSDWSKAIIVQTKKCFLDTKILKSKENAYLKKILPKKLRKKKLKLIFRASRDGWTSSQFHAKCDGRGATITLVRSTFGHVFGGYTAVPWHQTANNYSYDANAFIFLLRSSRGKVPQKYGVTNPGNAVYNANNYCPTFGGGFDFYLCTNCNVTNSSYSNLGNSYSAPKDNSHLTGGYNFKVKEYEVFLLK